MTHYSLADLAMADRHVSEGEAHITRQEALLSTLRLKGLSTGEAEKLLILMNETQVQHRTHREAIAAALEEASGPFPSR